MRAVEKADAVDGGLPVQRVEGLIGGGLQALAVEECVAGIAHHLLQRRLRLDTGRIGKLDDHRQGVI